MLQNPPTQEEKQLSPIKLNFLHIWAYLFNMVWDCCHSSFVTIKKHTENP